MFVLKRYQLHRRVNWAIFLLWLIMASDIYNYNNKKDFKKINKAKLTWIDFTEDKSIHEIRIFSRFHFSLVFLLPIRQKNKSDLKQTKQPTHKTPTTYISLINEINLIILTWVLLAPPMSLWGTPLTWITWTVIFLAAAS